MRLPTVELPEPLAPDTPGLPSVAAPQKGWERRLAGWLVGLGILALIFFTFLGAAREVLAVAFIAIIVASAVRTPAMVLTRRFKLGFAWAAIFTYLLALGLVAALLAVAVPGIVGEASAVLGNRTRLQSEIANLLRQAQAITGGQLEESSAGQLSEELINSTFQRISWESFAGIAASGALWALVILALSFYWLMDRDRILAALLRRVPLRHLERAKAMFEETEDGLARFVLGQLAAGVIVGTIAAIGLLLLGVPFAISLGLILVLCELLPAVGGWIAGILMAIVAANQSILLAAIVLAGYFALQQLDGYVISPLVQQRAIHLRPLVVLLAVLLGGVTLGVVGALLGVPFAIVITVLLKHLYPERRTEPGV